MCVSCMCTVASIIQQERRNSWTHDTDIKAENILKYMSHISRYNHAVTDHLLIFTYITILKFGILNFYLLNSYKSVKFSCGFLLTQNIKGKDVDDDILEHLWQIFFWGSVGLKEL